MEAAPMEFEGLAITDALVHTGLLIIDRTPYRIYSYIYTVRDQFIGMILRPLLPVAPVNMSYGPTFFSRDSVGVW